MIDRIEVLRDGASAQYGSDAIAGVINLVLKSTAENEVQVTGGSEHDELQSAAAECGRGRR